jgi:hypothetical protein
MGTPRARERGEDWRRRGGGAVLGAILGGKKGAIIGSTVGAGAGGAAVAASDASMARFRPDRL